LKFRIYSGDIYHRRYNKVPSKTYLKKTWHSVGPFSDWKSRIGFSRRVAAGVLKGLDLIGTPLRPDGTCLANARKRLLNGRLAHLCGDVDRHILYRPQSKRPEADPDNVKFEREGKVWVARAIPGCPAVFAGLYYFVEDNRGNRHITNLTRTFLLTEEVQKSLAPVRDLQKESVEALSPDNNGWKLHLNFDHTNEQVKKKIRAVLMELLAFNLIYDFKIGGGGGVEFGAPGKEATVYIGHGYAAKKVAEYLQENIADVLLPPEGDALTDDILLTSLVAGRFCIDDGVVFHQYGGLGVPYLMNSVKRREGGEEARDKAYRLLEERYGDFFAAGFEGVGEVGGQG
jgi:hypothetical protein